MSQDKAGLGTRMKEYEYVTRTYLMRRTPVIIRLDGNAFHTFTQGFTKPFDDIMVRTMQDTMKYLCENITGCVFGYTQSDEITLVLQNYEKLTTEPWFDNNVQKICSVSASMATLAFNRFFRYNVDTMYKNDVENSPYWSKRNMTGEDSGDYKYALFDSRVFNIPKEEVNNCLLWRQLDATRNSIQSLAQSLYTPKELQGISNKKLQDKMFTEKGVNWNDLPTHLKRGSCCIRQEVLEYVKTPSGEMPVQRSRWTINNEIPIFSQNPEYLNKRIIFE